MTHSTKKLSLEQHIAKFISVHGSEHYDYSLITEIKNCKIKLPIKCNIHKIIFQMNANSHKRGSGCRWCSGNGGPKFSLSECITNFKKKHGNKYDYSLIKEYVNNHTDVPIKCIKHNYVFFMRPVNHQNGQNCPKCAGIEKFTKEEFVEIGNRIHHNFFDYEKFIYVNNRTKGIIICPIHGEFLQSPNSHLNQEHSCPKCRVSKGEKTIINILNILNLKYKYNYSFVDCVNPLTNRKLYFDFALFNSSDDLICLIEYDGEYHFNPIKNNRFTKFTESQAIQNLKNQKYRDSIKDNFCIKNNIRLIRIPYNEFQNIESILRNNLLNYISIS